MSEFPISDFPRFTSANARLAPAWVARGIQPENIECGDSGSVSIALEPDWIPLLASLQDFSPALSITRNSHAIIGRKGALPNLKLANEEGTSAYDCEGAYDYEFAYWHSARIVFPNEDYGSVPSVEFVDAHGDIHHKICLYQENAFSAAAAWAKAFQRKELSASHEARADYYMGRIDQECSRSIVRNSAFLMALIQDAVVTRRKIRVIVGNSATVEGHAFHPQELRQSGQWIFLSDQQHALHLRVENLAEVCITPDIADSSLVVKAYEPEGRLAVVFCVPPDTNINDWNDFIQRNLNSHS